MSRVIVEIMRMDLRSLEDRTGLKAPRLSRNQTRQLVRLFVAAIMGHIEMKTLEEWKGL